ncbi:MAG: threonine synthase [Oscillospiraceae bacterium]|nr:threonine synthase [Oscillospiraceae bacterium]
MIYKSTRDSAAVVTAGQAITQGISADGGLFVPAAIPTLDMDSLRGLSYSELAVKVLAPFLSDYTEDELRTAVTAAYAKFGEDPAPLSAPLTSAHDARLLELWHGPTCAFKDMALQLLPRLMRTGDGELVILVATSGDTGKAALEGFRDVLGTRLLVFYPAQGVSVTQRLQMVTQEGDNVGVCAIKGNFDDAQTGVKALFADAQVNAALAACGMRFSSANSINWGRLVPQIVYYAWAWNKMAAQGAKTINVAVPTGNFGNILAAYYAKRMGVPIAKLICASNQNRVLADFLATSVYDRRREFYATASPSMDILISSNLERLLYHLSGDDDGETRRLMADLKADGVYTVSDAVKNQLDTLFAGGWCGDAAAAGVIRETFEQDHYLLDTHTAVAVQVYRAYRARTGDDTPTVIASTASPFKFSDSVLRALGVAPLGDALTQLETVSEMAAPAALKGLADKPVRFDEICTKDTMRDALGDMLGVELG